MNGVSYFVVKGSTGVGWSTSGVSGPSGASGPNGVSGRHSGVGASSGVNDVIRGSEHTSFLTTDGGHPLYTDGGLEVLDDGGSPEGRSLCAGEGAHQVEYDSEEDLLEDLDSFRQVR